MTSNTAFVDNFFNMAPGTPTGFTPFMNGSMNDPNIFDAQYQMQLNAAGPLYSDNAASTEISGINPRSYSIESSNSRSSGSPANSSLRSRQQRQRSSKTSRTQSKGSEDNGKRDKFLARNRLAASKCRTKKKEWTNNLEAAARQASQQSRELQAIVQRLRDEVKEYKTQLMNHHGCDCEQIQHFMQIEQAKRYGAQY